MSKSKQFHVEFGSHSDSLAHGESFHRRRRGAERIRRWWVDSPAPTNRTGDRWARIEKVQV